MFLITWLRKLIWYLPAGVASLAALISLAATAIFAAWLLASPNHAVGRVLETVDLPDRGVRLFALEAAAGAPVQRLVVDDALLASNAPAANDWVLAYGLDSLPGAGGRILVASNIVWTSTLTMVPDLSELRLKLGRVPVVALIVGAFFLIAGALLGQRLGALVLGTVLAVSTWHAAQIANFHGLIELPSGGAYPLAVLAMTAGLAIGLRAGQNRIADGMQRLVAVMLLVAVLPEMAPAYGWNQTGAMAVALPLTLVAPLTLYVLAGTSLIGIGLSAHGAALYVLLAICAMSAIVIRALADPESEPRTARSPSSPIRPQALSLFDLLVRR
jgi:hypothetical protein